jgi:predicted nucleic acid-binding protein
MEEIFLDTNIAIDYLTNREPFAQFALQLFALAENSKVRLSISARNTKDFQSSAIEVMLPDEFLKINDLI